MAGSTFKDYETIVEAFRTGEGVGWHEHHGGLFLGTERFFRPGYNRNLTTSWIPHVVKTVEERHEIKLLAGKFLRQTHLEGYAIGQSRGLSRFVRRFDGLFMVVVAVKTRIGVGLRHDQSRRTVPAADVGNLGAGFQLLFDAFECRDSEGASAYVLESLKPNGTWMIVEPFANDKLEDNFNPVGRLYYSASTTICTPASRSHKVGAALGNQVSEPKLRDVVTGGGFTQFRLATHTPFNRVFEARP